MSRKDRNNKQPRATSPPSSDKMPRASSLPSDNCIPLFKPEEMDMDGPFGWKKFDPLHMPEFLEKIFDFQKFSWQQLREQGSHLIDVAKIVDRAKRRLRDLKKDDLDQLFSLRLTGKKRIWGIKENNILRLLWWDPEHEVCPSLLKNT